MKQAAANTCPLATGQPMEATSIQQPAGRGGFARMLSSTEDSPGLGRGVWEGRAWAVSAHMPRSVQCPEFGGRKVKSGLCSGAMLFLYKATQGDVSLDTVGAKSRKKISLITAPRVVLFCFSPLSHHFTHKAGAVCLMGPAGQHSSWRDSSAPHFFWAHLSLSP